MAKKNLTGPEAIDLDRQTKLVFWINHNDKSSTVESVDYDGNNRKLLYRDSKRKLHGVTFFSSCLFISYSSNGSYGVLKLNASNGALISHADVPLPGRPWRLVTYDMSRQLAG